MHAVVITEPGGPDVLQWTEVPEPVPGPGEVLVDVAASAVNRADMMQRQGFYDPPKGASPYPGLECSGTIEAVGAGVTGWQPGDQVCALLSGGGISGKPGSGRASWFGRSSMAGTSGRVLSTARSASTAKAKENSVLARSSDFSGMSRSLGVMGRPQEPPVEF